MDHPFKVFAEYFPYKNNIHLSNSDRNKLISALTESIRARIARGESADSIGLTAAYHFVYLDKDYGIQYSKEYYKKLTEIPNLTLSDSFFKRDQVKDLMSRLNLQSTKK